MLCDMNDCFNEFVELCKTRWLKPAAKLVMHHNENTIQAAEQQSVICSVNNTTRPRWPNPTAAFSRASDESLSHSRCKVGA